MDGQIVPAIRTMLIYKTLHYRVIWNSQCTAGIPAEKEAVLHALKTGALFPFFRPTLYGKKTHQEVCLWAGLDETFRSPTIPESTRPPVIENGLSARANHCLFRAGIPAEKPAVKQALQSGALRPGPEVKGMKVEQRPVSPCVIPRLSI